MINNFKKLLLYVVCSYRHSLVTFLTLSERLLVKNDFISENKCD